MPPTSASYRKQQFADRSDGNAMDVAELLFKTIFVFAHLLHPTAR